MSNPYQSRDPEPRPASGIAALFFGDRFALIRLPIVLGLWAAYYVLLANNESAAYGVRGPFLLAQHGGFLVAGTYIAAACMTAISSAVVWPRWYTAYLAAFAVVVWLAAAAYVVVRFD